MTSQNKYTEERINKKQQKEKPTHIHSEVTKNFLVEKVFDM